MNAETELAAQLTKALRGESTSCDLAALRLAIRSHRELTLYAIHNALTTALENVAASKFGDDMASGR